MALVALVLVRGSRNLYALAWSFQQPGVYLKDFLQDYVFARAVLDGIDPYQLETVLARRYVGLDVGVPVPTPHPPPLGLLFVPLGLVDYVTAAVIWTGIDLVCLVGVVCVLARTANLRPGIVGTGIITIGLLGWYPVYWDVLWGNVIIPLLLCLAGARLALLTGHSLLGGVALGVGLLIKPVLWPFVVLFALRRDWPATVTSLLTIALGYATASFVLGPGAVARYFTYVAPTVADTFRASFLNLSISSVGWRLFHGTESPVDSSVAAAPVVHSEPAAVIVAAGLPMLVLILGLFWARRQQSLDPAIGVMACVSVLISPIVSDYYYALAVIPAAYVIGRLASRGFPSKETNAALAIGLVLLTAPQIRIQLPFALVGESFQPGVYYDLPFAAAIVTLVPLLAAAGLALLVAMLAWAEHEPSGGVRRAAAGSPARREDEFLALP